MRYWRWPLLIPMDDCINYWLCPLRILHSRNCGLCCFQKFKLRSTHVASASDQCLLSILPASVQDRPVRLRCVAVKNRQHAENPHFRCWSCSCRLLIRSRNCGLLLVGWQMAVTRFNRSLGRVVARGSVGSHVLPPKDVERVLTMLLRAFCHQRQNRQTL